VSGVEPIALVLGSAALQAAGNALQKQRVATHVPNASLAGLARRPGAFFAPLLRDPAWLAGGVLIVAGALVGLQALASLDLSVLKALGRLETLLMVVAGVVLLGERLRPGELAGLAVLLAGTALLALHGGGASGRPATREAHLALVASVAAVLALCASRPRAQRSELGLATAAGLLFGTGDILVKGATARVAVPGGFRVLESTSLAGLAQTPEFALAIIGYLAGAILLQAAFSVGRVSVIGAVTTLGSVALPIAFGLLVLGEDASAERLAGMAAIGLGALLLGRRGRGAREPAA
jgi:drug/metabolite transporter (DMT)-like permease